MFDEEDIEELFAEARRSHTYTPQEHWNTRARIADAILRLLPGAQVATGQTELSGVRTDYIPLSPNPPINVFAPDGRQVVEFAADGSWRDEDGRKGSVPGIIEGTPVTVAESLIVRAGLKPTSRRDPGPLAPHDDGMHRLFHPLETNTWRDGTHLPAGLQWGDDTPPSICRPSMMARAFIATYDPRSCTYSSAYHSRWGLESLRIPVNAERSATASGQPRAGDTLVTFGEKFTGSAGEYDHNDDVPNGHHLWHPQLIVDAEPEGFGHLRVWLVRDAHVANDHALTELLPDRLTQFRDGTRQLDTDDARNLFAQFQLNVFCDECGNRAKPIVYGMPGPNEPSYLALGGCVISQDEPHYICQCSNEWRDE